MNARVQACSEGTNQMLRLLVLDPQSWRGWRHIYTL